MWRTVSQGAEMRKVPTIPTAVYKRQRLCDMFRRAASSCRATSGNPFLLAACPTGETKGSDSLKNSDREKLERLIELDGDRFGLKEMRRQWRNSPEGKRHEQMRDAIRSAHDEAGLLPNPTARAD